MKPKLNTGQRVDASTMAQMLGISRQHLTRLCRAGLAPHAYRSAGGHWRFRWSTDLEAMVVAYRPKSAKRARRSAGAVFSYRPARDGDVATGSIAEIDQRAEASIGALQTRLRAIAQEHKERIALLRRLREMLVRERSKGISGRAHVFLGDDVAMLLGDPTHGL